MTALLSRLAQGLAALLLFLMATAVSAQAQSVTWVSVPFPNGFIGTMGKNSNKNLNILNWPTIGIASARFMQPSTTGLFGGTQGNDLSGILRIVTDTGAIIDIPGAVNWRMNDGKRIDYFGVIPDPNAAPVTFAYPGGVLTVDSTSNIAMGKIGIAMQFPDGSDVSGNAALGQAVNDLNAYLLDTRQDAPVITDPATGSGNTTGSSTITVIEGNRFVFDFNADTTTEWVIGGGTDAARFSIDRATGVLNFLSAPEFDTPADADGDNSYLVEILAIAPDGNTSSLLVEVLVIEQPSPNIETTKTISPVSLPASAFNCATDPAAAGAEVMTPGICLEYVITLASATNGSNPVADLTLTDALPPEMAFVSIIDTSGFDAITVFNGTITGQIQSFGPGESAQLRVRGILQ